MFNLKKIQQEKEQAKTSGQKASVGTLRLQKDISELDVPLCCKMDMPDPDDLNNFSFAIKPPEGIYKDATFTFTFNVPQGYPYDPPKVKCRNKIYHPNIDLDGNVCLNILREEWKPVLNLSTVVYGLLHLMEAPNPNDPLNKEAAKVMLSDQRRFEANVYKSLRGGFVDGEQYDKVMAGGSYYR